MPSARKKRQAQRFLTSISFWISVSLSLLMMVAYVLSRPEIEVIRSTGLLDIIEAKTLDIRFWLRGTQEPGHEIVIVGVDEKADDELGRWQSSGRRWIARLVSMLDDAGAKVVGFDLALAEPDDSAALEAVASLKRQYVDQLPREELSGQPSTNTAKMLTSFDDLQRTHDYDRQLAQALHEAGNVILGLYHFLAPESASHLSPEQYEAYRQIIRQAKYTAIKFPAGMTRQPLSIVHSYGVEPNLSLFSDAAKSFGHFNVIPSRDGSIRYSPLLIEYMGEYYPSLDMEVARAYLNPPLPPIIHALGKEGAGTVDSIQLGNIRIPSDEEGKLFINYYGPGHTFPHYSISDVILGRIPSEAFRDKIVLLGFTSAIYQDVHSTPFEQGSYPGVEVHATIIENILRQDFLTRPQWTILLDAAIIFLLGLVLGVVLHRMHSLLGAFIALGCLLAFAGMSHVIFLTSRIWLNVTYPMLFILFDYLTITSYKYFIEEKKRREIKQAFQHYVAPPVVEQMLETVDQLRLGGDRKQLTALFSDIRGFTSISESMEPEELVQFLNQYLSTMTGIILEQKGTVDKYMGDAIMAFYGAPIAQKDHAIRACKSAVEMIRHLKTFHETQLYNTTWKTSSKQDTLLARLKETKELVEIWQAKGLWPLNIGIGINSGEMIVGNMGSEERFDYTIMGDHVNLASRLEGANKQYGTNILLSQFTYEQIQEEAFIVREIDSVRVKGKQHPVTIYELLEYDEPGNERLLPLVSLFHDGMTAYKQRQWDLAMKTFGRVLESVPGDGPSAMYVDRCREYLRHPPAADWDGVFVMRTK